MIYFGIKVREFEQSKSVFFCVKNRLKTPQIIAQTKSIKTEPYNCFIIIWLRAYSSPHNACLVFSGTILDYSWPHMAYLAIYPMRDAKWCFNACEGLTLTARESDVYRRQILTSKDDPPTVRVKIFLLVVDP